MKLRDWMPICMGLSGSGALLNDPVVAKLLDLTDRMEAGSTSYGPVCDAVAAFEAALFEYTTNWGSYLSNAVLEARRTSACDRPPPGSWMRCCKAPWTASCSLCSSCAG